ncbi:MAG: aldolase [Tyzzerella sp.]|nr:aldolase [Tyzzerella sp.]
MALTLMYITNNPDIAKVAEEHGVERIWVDLEILGKEERQKNMDCVKSHHTLNDVKIISKILKKSELMVRINPWNKDSVNEIENVISAGAKRIMLPMWKTFEEVDTFLSTVKNRVPTTLLLETKEAVECLDDVIKHPLLDEIHIGLNDLHLSYNLSFMFELLTNGTVETICRKLHKAGIPYGFGGIAQIGTGQLPAEMIMTEHYRLKSTRVILSRGFCKREDTDSIQNFEKNFANNMLQFREYESKIDNLSTADYVNNINEMKSIVDEIVEKQGVCHV